MTTPSQHISPEEIYDKYDKLHEKNKKLQEANDNPMTEVIIHHDGAFNMYSLYGGTPIFEPAINEGELRRHIKEKLLQELDQTTIRIARAREFGVGSVIPMSLKYRITHNVAGDNRANLSFTEFVDRFMTLDV